MKLHKIKFLLVLVTIFSALLPGNMAWATQSGDHEAALEAIQRGEILPFDQFKRKVEKKFDGKLVGQKLRRTNVGWVYVVRIRAHNGRIFSAIVDAKTGRDLTAGNVGG